MYYRIICSNVPVTYEEVLCDMNCRHKAMSLEKRNKSMYWRARQVNIYALNHHRNIKGQTKYIFATRTLSEFGCVPCERVVQYGSKTKKSSRISSFFNFFLWHGATSFSSILACYRDDYFIQSSSNSSCGLPAFPLICYMLHAYMHFIITIWDLCVI